MHYPGLRASSGAHSSEVCCSSSWDTRRNRKLPIGKETSVLTRSLFCLMLLSERFLVFSSSLRMRRLCSSALTDSSKCATCCSATCPTRDTRCVSRNVGRLLAPPETLLGETPGSSGEKLLQFSVDLDFFPHQLLPSLTVYPISMLHRLLHSTLPRQHLH